MGLKDLSGVPWHIEKFTRAEGDERRHRSNCKYFRKADAFCALYKEKCHGSAHCDNYVYIEKTYVTQPIVIKNQKKDYGSNKLSDEQKERLLAIKNKRYGHRSKENEKKDIKVGTHVNHNIFGEGIIVEINSYIVVQFDNGEIKRFKKDTNYFDIIR